MKSKIQFLSVMLMMLPSMAMAQENIKRMFGAVQESVTNSQHFLDRDPETGRKVAQADVYDGIMLKDPLGKQVIMHIQSVFDTDKEAAYSVNSGSNYVLLAVGEGGYRDVPIGKIKDSQYIYACFLDKDDPEKKHRYVYAMEWAETGDSIRFRLAVTYALMPKYREKSNRFGRIIINGKEIDIPDALHTLNESFGGNGSEWWLSKFNNLRTLFLKKSEGPAANSWATEIYKLCKNADSLDEAERVMVAQEIAKLKTSTNDEFIKNLFDMCIKRLGK